MVSNYSTALHVVTTCKDLEQCICKYVELPKHQLYTCEEHTGFSNVKTEWRAGSLTTSVNYSLHPSLLRLDHLNTECHHFCYFICMKLSQFHNCLSQTAKYCCCYGKITVTLTSDDQNLCSSSIRPSEHLCQIREEKKRKKKKKKRFVLQNVTHGCKMSKNIMPLAKVVVTV